MTHNSDIPAIRLDHVKAGGGAFRLGPLTFDIPRGLVTAIIGPNGSGKSTLFRTLLGLEPVAEGAAEVLGTRVEPGGDDSYKADIGFLAENPHTYENMMTAAEKAHFASLWYPGWDERRYRSLMNRFDVNDRMKLSKMSKGNRRKAEISIAMAHHPNLLLLDEPSSGLDPASWKFFLEELQLYMEPGDRTLVMATHVTEEVKRLADNILFLYKGRLLGMFEKDRLFDGWRSLLVRGGENVSDAHGLFRKMPGWSRITDAGQDVYRVQTNGAGAEDTYLRSCGFQVLESRRMELEDILSCMIEKEEANHESA